MTKNKSELIKNVMINLGILFVLVSTTTSKDLGIGFFSWIDHAGSADS